MPIGVNSSFNILPKFRGSPVSNQEKKQLNHLGGKILREAGLDFEEWKDYDWITKGVRHRFGIDDEGYADYYLVRCWNESKKVNEADTSIYRQLVEIDLQLGTDDLKQLSCCLSWTTRWDIIKVLFHVLSFNQKNAYERIRRILKWAGFAEIYLERCNQESKTDDKIDVKVYTRLIELDTKLGTRISEQLFLCLLHTIRWDIIKVKINTGDKLVNIT